MLRASGAKRKCTDKAGFKDSYGACKKYERKKWCAEGGAGSGWQASWGKLGQGAAAACCACGGGTTTGAGATTTASAIHVLLPSPDGSR